MSLTEWVMTFLRIVVPSSSGSSSPRRANQEEIILSYDMCAF